MIGLVITTLNQVNTLYYSLQSAINQKNCETEQYQIIVIDYNSTDDTQNMVRKYFPSVILYTHNKNKPFKHILDECNLDEIIFSKGNVLFSSNFISSHNEFKSDIVLSKSESCNDKINVFFNQLHIPIKNCIIKQRYFDNYKEIIKMLSEKHWVNNYIIQEETVTLTDIKDNYNEFNCNIYMSKELFNNQFNEIGEINNNIFDIPNINFNLNSKGYSISL